MQELIDYRDDINRLLVRIFNQIIKEETVSVNSLSSHRLTISEMHTLEAIGCEQDTPMSRIASALGITTGTLTVSVNRLIQKGLAQRNKKDNDRRIVYVTLTEDGKRIVHAHKLFHIKLTGRAISGLSDNELELLPKLLKNILNIFDNKIRDVKTADA